MLGVVQGREVNGSGLVVTPFGRHYAECVHGVPDGAVVVNDDTHLVVHHETFAEPRRIRRCNLAFPSRPPSMRDSFDDDDSGVNGNGWQAYVEQKLSGRVTKMLGRWTTPELPSEDAQTLFTFPGLQNINWCVSPVTPWRQGMSERADTHTASGCRRTPSRERRSTSSSRCCSTARHLQAPLTLGASLAGTSHSAPTSCTARSRRSTLATSCLAT